MPTFNSGGCSMLTICSARNGGLLSLHSPSLKSSIANSQPNASSQLSFQYNYRTSYGAGDEMHHASWYSSTMKFGLFGMNMRPCITPETIAAVAHAAEDAGFESFWGGEHLALADPQTPSS